ncbi:MAG TPA: hypothetical protein PLU30_20200 [Verrucomicrobiae bacterium]|nr:hypothetical protein [Verrucomicrobiae bacterium]
MKDITKAMAVLAAGLMPALAGHAGGFKGVSTVSVAEEVTMPKNGMGYSGATGAWGAGLFGAIGGAVASAGNTDPRNKYADLARANNIDVAEMFRTAFIERLKGAGVFDQVGAAPAQGQFQLQIKYYSMQISVKSLGEMRRMQPTMMVVSTLRDSGGKQLWQKNAVVAKGAKQPKGSNNEGYWADPELYRQDWKIVANLAAERLIEPLAKGSKTASGSPQGGGTQKTPKRAGR